jgi:hypothetical protein
MSAARGLSSSTIVRVAASRTGGARSSTTTNGTGSWTRAAVTSTTSCSPRRTRCSWRRACTIWRPGTRPSATARGEAGRQRWARSCDGPSTLTTGRRSTVPSRSSSVCCRSSAAVSGGAHPPQSSFYPATSTMPTWQRWPSAATRMSAAPSIRPSARRFETPSIRTSGT